MELEQYIKHPVTYYHTSSIQRARIHLSDTLELSVIRIDPRILGYDVLETCVVTKDEVDVDSIRRFNTIEEFLEYYRSLA